MEKFGLFDLIDKFNAAANGKNDFAKSNASAKKEQSPTPKSNLVDPQISAPKQYVMNAKLLDFCKKHDEISKRITIANAKRK